MVLTEKFTRTALDEVTYEFTIDDPSTFTDIISAVVPMTKTSGQLYEYACHEGNTTVRYYTETSRYERLQAGE